jgi:hypothetical protein
MANSVRTKALKKQQGIASPGQDARETQRLEQAALRLEDAVLKVLEASKGYKFHDVDFLYWDRRLKNIATHLSLALAEYKGPRRFHYHYRHDPKNHEQLYPVMGPAPIAMLLRVCREGYAKLDEMVGLRDAAIREHRTLLQQAIRGVMNAAKGIDIT